VTGPRSEPQVRARRTGRAGVVTPAVRYPVHPGRHGDERRTRFTAPAVLIDPRPDQALGRQRKVLLSSGGAASRDRTLVDRASRYVRLTHLLASHDALAVRDGLLTILASLLEVAGLRWPGINAQRWLSMTRSRPRSAKVCSPPTGEAPVSIIMREIPGN